ncbi:MULTISPECIES: hypothetical protein [unclassified Streptomyces]|uniref:hypothetical protein n=1 Tax=unclassified Streptomyces TaxID=2593676 RepID=UPI0004C7768D|nr:MULTISPECIES: hypothetical protein [unclassified Streptomyces]KPC79529.1 hypothetical protein ADK82_25705 [Streptomyces sp. NRRL S-4]
MTTKTLTLQDVIAENAETLNYLLDQDDVTALTPTDFVEALEDAGREFSGSFESTNQANGEAMAAAAVLLAEALALGIDDPDMPVLLRRAQRRLRDTEI